MEKIIAVYNLLNNIEVKGQNNVFNMAACLQVMKDVIDAAAVENGQANNPT